jgi:hypothetical protein
MATSYTPSSFVSVQPQAGVSTTVLTLDQNSNDVINIVISNTKSDSNDFFSIAIKPKNERIDVKHYIAFITELYPSGQVSLPSIFLGPNYQVIVLSVNGFASFNITGGKFSN